MLFRNWNDNMLRLGQFCYFLWHSTDRGFVKISYRGILEPFEKTVSSYREAGNCIYSHVESLNKKVSNFQIFSLDVIIFNANAVKAKELREGDRPLWGGGGVSWLLEHRNNWFIARIDWPNIAKYDRIVSPVWIAWSVRYKSIKRSQTVPNIPEHDACQNSHLYVPTKLWSKWLSH
jgi:hypothetical protein